MLPALLGLVQGQSGYLGGFQRQIYDAGTYYLILTSAVERSLTTAALVDLDQDPQYGSLRCFSRCTLMNTRLGKDPHPSFEHLMTNLRCVVRSSLEPSESNLAMQSHAPRCGRRYARGNAPLQEKLEGILESQREEARIPGGS